MEHRGQPTYLELVSYYEIKGVFVKTIKPESKFYGTKIAKGMKIIRINGVACPATVTETFGLIKAANEVLTLTAVVIEGDHQADDFMFNEIKLDDDGGKNLQMDQVEPEKEENATSPSRVTTDWFDGILGTNKNNEDDSKEKKVEYDRKERIADIKKAAVKTERDRIGLGFADQVLKDLGVLDQDGEDNDSLYTYEQDDTTYRSAPTVDDMSYNKSTFVDDDDFTLSTAGGTTIIDSSPIVAKIFKKTKRDNLGLHFVSFKKKRGIYVYRIHEESRFLSTKLEPGMRLLTINSKPCPATVAETLALVQNIEGDLWIKAHYPAAEDVNDPEPQKSEEKDLTGVQVPAAFGIVEKAEEKKLEEEKKEDDGESTGETEMLVAKLGHVRQSITNAVDSDKKEDNEKESLLDGPSEYESLPPPTNAEQ